MSLRERRSRAGAVLTVVSGLALVAGGLPAPPAAAADEPTAAGRSRVPRPQRTGRECPECRNPTLARIDGCDQCGSCGWIGSCG